MLRMPPLLCLSIKLNACSHSNVFLLVSVPKKQAKSLKNTCEKGHVHFIFQRFC